jgi:hypothetical protein
MKKYISIIVLLAITSVAFAQDQTINGNLTTTGKLYGRGGVFSLGTENLTELTQLYMQIKPQNMAYGEICFRYGTADKKATIRSSYNETSGGNLEFFTFPKDGITASRLLINGQGNIGIGTTSPQYKLDVNGTFFAKDALFGNNAPGSSAKFIIRGPNSPFGIESKREISFEFVAAGKSIIRTFRGNSYGNYMQFLTTDDSGATPKVRLHIDKDGHIAIGSETAKYMLDVAGTIRAKEVKIEMNAGDDHIFYSNYCLMPLSEVETFVKENKHLPEIPSEKQMVQEGLNVNEMQIKLLQKIEELTLYVIEQDKKIEILQKESISIKNELVNFKDK